MCLSGIINFVVYLLKVGQDFLSFLALCFFVSSTSLLGCENFSKMNLGWTLPNTLHSITVVIFPIKSDDLNGEKPVRT